MVLVAALLGACGDQEASDGDTPGADGGSCTPVTESITPPEGATLAYMERCTVGDDDACETGVCFNFTSRGPHCTAPCTQACECPAPSGGCSNRGVCKAPGG